MDGGGDSVRQAGALCWCHHHLPVLSGSACLAGAPPVGVPGVTWEAFFFKNLLPVRCGMVRNSSGSRRQLLQYLWPQQREAFPHPQTVLQVTLGNIVAGTLCVATAYSLAYGSLGKKVWPPKQA